MVLPVESGDYPDVIPTAPVLQSELLPPYVPGCQLNGEEPFHPSSQVPYTQKRGLTIEKGCLNSPTQSLSLRHLARTPVTQSFDASVRSALPQTPDLLWPSSESSSSTPSTVSKNWTPEINSRFRSLGQDLAAQWPPRRPNVLRKTSSWNSNLTVENRPYEPGSICLDEAMMEYPLPGGVTTDRAYLSSTGEATTIPGTAPIDVNSPKPPIQFTVPSFPPTTSSSDFLENKADPSYYVTNQLNSMTSDKQAMIPRPEPDNTMPTPSVDDGDTESSDTESSDTESSDTELSDTESNIDDDESTLSNIETVVSILGPEYGHVAQRLINKLTFRELPLTYSGFQRSATQADDTAGLTSDTPSEASCSSKTPGGASSSDMASSASPLNTPFPSHGSEKRKSTGKGDGDDSGDADENDGDGHRDKQFKRAGSEPKPRYDCPIFRRAIPLGASSKNRLCALGGLEFRHVWNHLTKVHLGCQVCGKKLDTHVQVTTHVLERGNVNSTCQGNMEAGSRYEIGIELWLRMMTIYKNKALNHEQKWREWWKLLCPKAGDADIPDPRHHEGISLSNIPTLQFKFHEMWQEYPRLPQLTNEQIQDLSTLLSRLSQLFTVGQGPRNPRKSRRKEASPRVTEAERVVVQANNTNIQDPQTLSDVLYGCGQDGLLSWPETDWDDVFASSWS